jgi:hypothetical protein
MNKVTGLLLNAGVGASIDTVEITDLESIQNHVGGLIDAVRQPINDDIYVVGYVHDEGLILDLEMNWIASALFGREIRGSVVLVNGNNDVGEYDGYNHDLPNEFIEYMKTVFLARVATTYNESQIILALLQSAASDDIIEMEKLDTIPEISFVEGLIWLLSDYTSSSEPWETIERELAEPNTWEIYSPKYANTFARTWQSLLENPASKKTYAMYKQLYTVMQILYNTGKINKFGWDLHTANVMLRQNGQPVIIDPWFSEGTS